MTPSLRGGAASMPAQIGTSHSFHPHRSTMRREGILVGSRPGGTRRIGVGRADSAGAAAATSRYWDEQPMLRKLVRSLQVFVPQAKVLRYALQRQAARLGWPVEPDLQALRLLRIPA